MGRISYGLALGFWLTSPAAMPHSVPIRPSIALAAFAERFVDGRRVVVFGNALSPFWEQLIERGARLVHVCDSDATRVSEAAARNTSQSVSFAPLGGSGLAVRDGAFDVGFIEDLATHADPAATLHRLRRALSARGVALVAAPNPDIEEALLTSHNDNGRTIDYYSLYDSVHREFPVVRMAGQMPFVGYSVAELAPADEPTPCIDAGFVPGGTEEPEWFVAIASQNELEFDAFLVVQLPHNQLTKNGAERLLREQLRSARSAERSAVERLSRLESEQRRLAEIAQRHQKDVDLARQIRLLQEELERKESWILQLEARAATADARADVADQELEELRVRVGPVSEDAGKPVDTHEDWRKSIERLETEKCELVARVTHAESRLADAEQRIAAEKVTAQERIAQAARERSELEQRLGAEQANVLTQLALAEVRGQEASQRLAEAQARLDAVTQELDGTAPQHAAEVAHLENQLKERGEHIRRLELDLKSTEETGAQLVHELARAKRPLDSLASQQTLASQIPGDVTPTSVVTHRDVPVAPASQTTSPAQTEATSPPPTVSTVATDNWTRGPTATTPASTHLSAAQSSAWTESPATAAEDPSALRAKLDSLSRLAAKQQADLTGYDWRLQQLLRENAVLTERTEKFEETSVELERLRERLQQNEVLFVQLAARDSS